MALEQELKIYQDHLPEWLTQRAGQFVLIKGNQTIGFYGNEHEALSEGARLFGLESFLIRRVQAVQTEASVPAYTLGIIHANA